MSANFGSIQEQGGLCAAQSAHQERRTHSRRQAEFHGCAARDRENAGPDPDAMMRNRDTAGSCNGQSLKLRNPNRGWAGRASASNRRLRKSSRPAARAILRAGRIWPNFFATNTTPQFRLSCQV